MFLVHETNDKYLKKIISDKKLKSNKITGNFHQGSGLYDVNPFVFFTATPKLFDNDCVGRIMLYY